MLFGIDFIVHYSKSGYTMLTILIDEQDILVHIFPTANTETENSVILVGWVRT